jgi:hypothetical protein
MRRRKTREGVWNTKSKKQRDGRVREEKRREGGRDLGVLLAHHDDTQEADEGLR